MSPIAIRGRTTGALAASLLVLLLLPAEAESEEFLSRANVREAGSCAILDIELLSRTRYLGHTPQAPTDELHIRLEPIDRTAVARSEVVGNEILRAPSNERAAIHAIELAFDAAGATLSVYFKKTVTLRIEQGSDLKGVAIILAGSNGFEDCPGIQTTQSPQAAQKAMSEAIDRQIAEARARLGKKEAQSAVEILSALQGRGTAAQTTEALELLGLAHQQAGDAQAAIRVFKEYLERYPASANSERVRTRLAGLEKKPAIKEPADTIRTISEHALSSAKLDAPASSTLTRQSNSSQPNAADGAETPDPSSWRVTQSGSLSTTYLRNQSSRDFFTAPRLQQGWERDSIDRTYQSSVLGTLDYDAAFDNSSFAGKLRFSGLREQTFLSDQDSQTAVSAAFLDAKFKDSGVSARLGRQSSYSGGVLGRFDGAQASINPTDGVKVTAVAGSPVERSRDTPFLRSTHFEGVSAEFSHADPGLKTGIFVIDQRRDGFIDREGVGAEFRYAARSASASGSIDYDVHFGELNGVMLAGAYVLTDRSVAGLSLDYRRAPVLATSNALAGQYSTSMKDLLLTYTKDEIERISLDRTARSFTGNASYTYPINEWLMLYSDATLAWVSGMPESAGVLAVDSLGLDFYGLLQLTANSLFLENDVVTGGVRFADGQLARRTMLETSVQLPLGKDWRVTPVFRLGFIDYKNDSRSEVHVMPSLRTSYFISRDMTLDFEVGRNWIERQTDHGTEGEVDLMLLAGIRYDFYGESNFPGASSKAIHAQ